MVSSPLVEKRLVYTTLQVSLVRARAPEVSGSVIPPQAESEGNDAAAPIELVRLATTTAVGGVPSSSSSAPAGIRPALVGRTFGVPRRAVLGGEDGWFLAYADLVCLLLRSSQLLGKAETASSESDRQERSASKRD